MAAVVVVAEIVDEAVTVVEVELKADVASEFVVVSEVAFAVVEVVVLVD